ncbi:hypothetical protein CPter91_4013 [Collimonas pratensis]|uniref:Uncharacterized protein n=2 Tax=Collimonas pratensis TaxID=279113 RepID=A0A127Q8G6_9BURK|nr:hypothetical protein CPter91_4013 [Collimonas pratensis]
MGSIVAISAIELLKGFMSVETASDRTLGWEIGIHMTFVLSALFLAIMDALMAKVRGEK